MILGISIGASVVSLRLIANPVRNKHLDDIEVQIASQSRILAEQNSALQKCRAIIFANNDNFSQYAERTGKELQKLNEQTQEIVRLKKVIDSLHTDMIKLNHDRNYNVERVGD